MRVCVARIIYVSSLGHLGNRRSARGNERGNERHDADSSTERLKHDNNYVKDIYVIGAVNGAPIGLVHPEHYI